MLWFFPSHVKKCPVIPGPNKPFKFHSFYILNRETAGHHCNLQQNGDFFLCHIPDTRVVLSGD